MTDLTDDVTPDSTASPDQLAETPSEASPDAPAAVADPADELTSTDSVEIAARPPAGKPATDGAAAFSDDLLADPYGEDDLDLSREDFAKLLGEYEDTLQDVREGEIVKAKVLRVTETSVILEFGFKSEGSVALDEFKEPETIHPGAEVDVLLESLEDDDGVVVLSKKKADFLRVWEKIKEAYENDEPVEGTLSRKIKGGVTVDLMGVDAFLPGSQIALRRVPNIEDLIGQVYMFKIIKLNKRRRNIVVSRRVILEGEREVRRKTLVKELLVGQVRSGVVKNITDFGAFVDLGGMDGLLHITDMSWGRVGHPSEVVNIGEDLDVKVLDIDWDRERISLGLKQLLPYPWTEIDRKYPVGSRVHGRVVSITNYGAFIELEKGVEGLVHISEMSWTRNVRHPSKLVAIGDEIEAVVLKVDPQEEKISLGMKQIEEDPWLALPLKYPSGTVLDGVVRNLTSFGAFVEIEPGIDGLVHVSDMSWTKRIEHPSEMVDKGYELKVMVLDVDSESKRISLGIKQLSDDPWPQIIERFAPGVEAEGTVVRLQDRSVVVDLGDDIEGFVPAAHSTVDDADRLNEYFHTGDKVDLRVVESDAGDRRIALEVTTAPERKGAPPEPTREDASSEEAAEATEAVGQSESDEPTAEATDEPTAEATDEPTAEATDEPTAEATDEPTAEATDEPTAEATDEPTAEATDEPTAEATDEPTAEATDEPTAEAADEPTAEGASPEEAEPTADDAEGGPTDDASEEGSAEKADPVA